MNSTTVPLILNFHCAVWTAEKTPYLLVFELSIVGNILIVTVVAFAGTCIKKMTVKSRSNAGSSKFSLMQFSKLHTKLKIIMSCCWKKTKRWLRWLGWLKARTHYKPYHIPCHSCIQQEFCISRPLVNKPLPQSECKAYWSWGQWRDHSRRWSHWPYDHPLNWNILISIQK